MDKELALAFEFQNAPETVKAAGNAHLQNWLRLEKAETQVKLWSAELEAARKAYTKSSHDFRKAIEAWDPAGSKTATPVAAPVGGKP